MPKLRIKKHFGWIYFSVLLTTNAWCTDIDYNFQYQQLGSGIYQVSNTNLSPLAYQGSGISFQKGSSKNWDKQLRTSAISMESISYGNANKQSHLSGVDISFSYNRYYQTALSLVPEMDVYIGGGYCSSLDMLSDKTNINNALFYSLNNSLNIGFFVGKKWGDYFFSNEFSIPIIGLYSSSEYGSQLPYTFYEDDIPFLSKADFGSLNLNNVFQNKFNFDVKAKTKKKTYTLRFNYTIIYGRQMINNITHTKAFHKIGVGYVFNRIHHAY